MPSLAAGAVAPGASPRCGVRTPLDDRTSNEVACIASTERDRALPSPDEARGMPTEMLRPHGIARGARGINAVTRAGRNQHNPSFERSLMSLMVDRADARVIDRPRRPCRQASKATTAKTAEVEAALQPAATIMTPRTRRLRTIATHVSAHDSSTVTHTTQRPIRRRRRK